MSKFPYTLYTISSIGDGSCFLHSVLRAISPDYTEKNKMGKIQMVREIREALSNMLEESPKGEDKTYYDLLSRGQLKDLSKTFDETKLENMKKFLRGNGWFNELYVEFISNVFDIDIYIIDHNKKELYIRGSNELFFKNRNSIILGYYNEAHFDTLSVKDVNGEKKTYFSPNSIVIKKLKKMLYKEKM